MPPEIPTPEQESIDPTSVIGFLQSILDDRDFPPDVVEDAIQDAIQRDMERWKEACLHPYKPCWEHLAAVVRERAVAYTCLTRRTVSLSRVAEIASPDEQEGVVESRNPQRVKETFMKEMLVALDTLPEKQRFAVRLCYLEGMTVKAIAERENVTRGTVCANKRRGLATLRRLLAEIIPPDLLTNRGFARLLSDRGIER